MGYTQFGEIYIEINAICIAILFAIWWQVHRDVDQQMSRQVFRILLVMLIVIQILDLEWIFVDSIPKFAFLNYLINATYMSLTGAIGFAWWLYVAYRLEQEERIQKYLFLIIIPLCVLVICAYASYYTGWIFVIDADGRYERGQLHFIQQTMAMVYYIFPFADLIRHITKGNHTQQRREELKAMLSFFALPAIGLFFNVVIPTLPSIWPAATASALLIYINGIKQQISMDELTGLNNRNAFDMRLQSMIAESDSDKMLYLFIMDLNSFKKINDTYGHVSGDHALRDTAIMLKEAVAGKNLFLARYGGDEFAILGRVPDEEAAVELKRTMKETFVMHQLLNRRPYKLSISIGYAPYEENMSAEQLIANADAKLYEDKKGYYNKA